MSSVHIRPRETVTRLALLSIALMALGAALSWFISRSITRPLNSLTVAAEALARGDYGRRVNAQGRDEIARLGGAFNQMAAEVAESRRALEERVQDARRAREEAEAANRAKSDFLAVMSHELRTPLNAINGYAQLLEMGIHGSLTDAQRDAIARINRSGAHLLTLINDVLNFARIDAGQVALLTCPRTHSAVSSWYSIVSVLLKVLICDWAVSGKSSRHNRAARAEKEC
jgi:signal transduction histidine kinase